MDYIFCKYYNIWKSNVWKPQEISKPEIIINRIEITVDWFMVPWGRLNFNIVHTHFWIFPVDFLLIKWYVIK